MRVTKGCPLCIGDVLGTYETGFYCKDCNMMFKKRHVIFKHVKAETRKLITKHFSGFGDEKKTPKEQERKVEIPSIDTSFFEKVSKNIQRHVKAVEGIPSDFWAVAERLAAERAKEKRAKKAKATPSAKKAAKRKKAPKRTAKKVSKKQAPKPKKTPKRAKKPAPKKQAKKIKKATKKQPQQRGLEALL